LDYLQNPLNFFNFAPVRQQILPFIFQYSQTKKSLEQTFFVNIQKCAFHDYAIYGNPFLAGFFHFKTTILGSLIKQDLIN